MLYYLCNYILIVPLIGTRFALRLEIHRENEKCPESVKIQFSS